MVFGVIKDYASRALGGVKSAGKSVGRFIKYHHAPILGAIEGASDVVKYFPNPAVSGVAAIVNQGMKGLSEMIQEVPNKEVQEQLKEKAKS